MSKVAKPSPGAKLGFPPRMMMRATAAAYLDLSIAEFDREVRAGRLSAPVRLGNHSHWDRLRLDEAVARLAGEVSPDWREDALLYRSSTVQRKAYGRRRASRLADDGPIEF